MDGTKVDELVEKLSAGFDALQVEYQKLFGQHSALERKLATAREQYNELAKLYGAGQTATPPLSLSSSPGMGKEDVFAPTNAADLLDQSEDRKSKEAARLVRAADTAASHLRTGRPVQRDSAVHGVKIWSGPSADTVERANSRMPSISESPLEQDFTVEGKPSKLGCPFASMANKKLSSHAASVLSRYNQNSSAGAHGSVEGNSAPLSTTSRVDGRQSLSRRHSRRTSIVDPIKAEICGLTSHHEEQSHPPRPTSAAKPPHPEVENADVGVCPIRFLDQHSPEEVATYFEKHKHELPRSHEVCVMRYQSNEEQIKQLDAKYGNLVSMIQGLGQKHKDMLPEEPDDEAELHPEEALDDAKVRKWASSVSAQAPAADEEAEEEEHEDEERQQHFERPLRDIRVGESPSRPWGIQVPVQYLEKDGERGGETFSEGSSRPARVVLDETHEERTKGMPEEATQKRPAGKCPFGHGGTGAAPAAPKLVASEVRPAQSPKPAATSPQETSKAHEHSRMIFTGPVFIGYSAEDAAKILSGWNGNGVDRKE